MIAKSLRQVSLPTRLLPKRHGSLFAPSGAAGLGSLILLFFPILKLSFFAGTAAHLASLFLGTPVFSVDQGWLLPSRHEPVLVSGACSGSDFWLMIVALLAWHLARRNKSTAFAITAALLCATPLAVAVNSIRIVAVVQAHRWFIPHWSESYGPFFHQLTGVAVFLPSLILIHALLEKHRSHRRT